MERLERAIDAQERELSPLSAFILPGGTRVASALHLARCIVRRAERQVVRAAAEGPIDSLVIAYVNRLSDLLFVLARRANRLAGVDDVAWHGSREPRTMGARVE